MDKRLSLLIDNIEQVIVGKRRVVELAIIGLLVGGHELLEDVPGVAKTMLARAVCQSVGGTFQRISFTPDLLPNDIRGQSIFNQKSFDFEFRAGPIFANVLLADEINRGTPKVQSAMLEAMEERQVTVDGVQYPLPPLFVVYATQNPIEYEGTYPLPEAQLDRFLFRLSVGYPDRESELEMSRRQDMSHPIRSLKPAISIEDVLALREEVKRVHLSPLVEAYIQDIIDATRVEAAKDDGLLEYGSSPRGALALRKAARAYAFICGRKHVTWQDVRIIVVPALAHRVILSMKKVPVGCKNLSVRSEEIIEELLLNITPPGGER